MKQGGNGSLRNRNISTCTACRKAIREHDCVVWQRGQVMGLVHQACATDPDATPVDITDADRGNYHRKDSRP